MRGISNHRNSFISQTCKNKLEERAGSKFSNNSQRNNLSFGMTLDGMTEIFIPVIISDVLAACAVIKIKAVLKRTDAVWVFTNREKSFCQGMIKDLSEVLLCTKNCLSENTQLSKADQKKIRKIQKSLFMIVNKYLSTPEKTGLLSKLEIFPTKTDYNALTSQIAPPKSFNLRESLIKIQEDWQKHWNAKDAASKGQTRIYMPVDKQLTEIIHTVNTINTHKLAVSSSNFVGTNISARI